MKALFDNWSLESDARMFFFALFVTALVTAQVIASKLIPVNLPLVGHVALPAGTLAYAFTFFATDAMSELYGRKYATKAVNIAFLMNFVLILLVYLAVILPASSHGIPNDSFRMVMLSSGNIVMGSLGAYLISQNFDVFAFHWYKDLTDGKYLWLRNIGSTGISQFIDTAIFTFIAFWLAPAILGVGSSLPLTVVWSIIVGQYFAKLLIAIGDTPLVYLATGLVKRSREASASPSSGE